MPVFQLSENYPQIKGYYITTTLRNERILQYVIIIQQDWTKYKYVDLVIR